MRLTNVTRKNSFGVEIIAFLTFSQYGVIMQMIPLLIRHGFSLKIIRFMGLKRCVKYCLKSYSACLVYLQPPLTPLHPCHCLALRENNVFQLSL